MSMPAFDEPWSYRHTTVLVDEVVAALARLREKVAGSGTGSS